MNFLKRTVFDSLENRRFSNDDELFLHLILLIGLVLAALIHAFFLVFFLIADVPFMVLANTVSLITYMGVYFLHRRQHYAGVGVAVTVEISLYSLVVGLASGLYTATFTFYFITLVIQAVIPYGKPPLRIASSLFIWACLTMSLVAGISVSPFAPFSNELTVVCGIMNVQITFVGVMAVLLVGDYIRKLITDFHRQKANEYREQAHKDSLTGQYNRHYANAVWSRLSRETPWVVAMLDIDNFKRINDRFGHQTGDDVLVAVSKLFDESLRASDIVIRWGGEEFLILLQSVDLNTAEQVLDKLRSKIGALVFTSNDEEFSITVSIGISTLDQNDIDGSISAADHKLFDGKHEGKDRISI